jgi:hypothetical protein
MSLMKRACDHLKATGWEFVDFGIFRTPGNEDGDDSGMVYLSISGIEDEKLLFNLQLVDPECVHQTQAITFTDYSWDLFTVLVDRLAQFNQFFLS